MAAAAVRVLIASPLEPDLVGRIASVDSRIEVLYEPGLLPRPRFQADHSGTPIALSAGQQEQWSSLRQQAEVSFDFDWQEPSLMRQNCPRLRWVQATSAGIGGFLQRTGLAGSDLIFTTAAGVHATPLAEFALLGMLYFAKGMPQLRAWQDGRHWERYTTLRLAGSRALVVGMGSIGREVARLLTCAGVEVVGAGRPGRRYALPGVHSFVSSDQLGEALPEVDALVLACPLTATTKGLIGAKELALLRPGAILVNVSRGAVVDEEAMVDALASGHLGGAFLDVFTDEPLPPDSQLWAMRNVVVSPHSAATVAAENTLLTELFCDNLRRFMRGRELRNVYDRTAGY
jgi:phosphoglycerate dehydrogenase-like enzyme